MAPVFLWGGSKNGLPALLSADTKIRLFAENTKPQVGLRCKNLLNGKAFFLACFRRAGNYLLQEAKRIFPDADCGFSASKRSVSPPGVYRRLCDNCHAVTLVVLVCMQKSLGISGKNGRNENNRRKSGKH